MTTQELMQELETVWAPRVLRIACIVAAVIFFEHGTQKLFGFPPYAPPKPGPAMFTLFWFAGVIEVVGGAALLLGLFTRPVAFIVSGEMAFAYWMGHAPKSIYPLLNAGDASILYCFFFLYIACAPVGPWSLDRMLWRKAA